MARAYINKLSELMERAAPKGSPEAKLEVKHFFSGAAVYANGKICITLTPIGLALKLPEEDIKSLIDEEGANFRFKSRWPRQTKVATGRESRFLEARPG